MLTSEQWARVQAAAEANDIKAETARSWRKPNRRIPAEYVPWLSDATGIPKTTLYPGWRERAPNRAA